MDAFSEIRAAQFGGKYRLKSPSSVARLGVCMRLSVCACVRARVYGRTTAPTKAAALDES